MRINLLRFTLVLFSLMFHFQGIAQVINRDPEQRKDFANVYYKPQYTLFDLRSDEPIFPKEDGKYHIYYASNEVKRPKSFVGTASELSRLSQYKFKDFESCKLWCDGIPFNANSEKTASTGASAQTINTNQSAGSSASIDSVFKFLVALGKDCNRPVRQYDTVGIHNQFYFSEKGGPLISKSKSGKLNSDRSGIDYKIEMDFFLKGIDSIGDHILKIEKEISNYKIPVCIQRGHPKSNVELYQALLDSKNIVIFNNGNLEDFYKLCKKHTPQHECHRKRTGCDESPVFIYFGSTCSKFEKRFVKAVKKGKFIRVEEANRKTFIKSFIGLDEKYFTLIKDIEKYKLINDFARANFFKKLEAPSNFDNFLYWGPLLNGVPDGFGLLLGKNKKLIISAYWSKGIPITLYDLNIYHNTNIEWGFHKYLVSNGQELCKNMTIELLPSIYKESNISTYGVYIGEYKNENDWGRSGFGSYFFERWNKSDKFLYSGNWESSKYNGEGSYYKSGYKYSGNFRDGDLKNGKCIWPDKTTYRGDFQNFGMHGFGILTYANGEIKNGYFQNNEFVKSLEQFHKEQEEKRIQEERILAEQAEEERKQNEIELAKEKENADIIMAALMNVAFGGGGRGSNQGRDNSNNRRESNKKPCSTCNKKPFNKSSLDKNCSVIVEEMNKPGFVLCSTCYGYGYMRTNIGCDCSGGWCYEKDCYNSSCQNGWDECDYCKGSGYD
jgi:hypothetical protein